MSQPTIFFLEDDARLRKSFALEFEDRGYRVFEAASPKEIPIEKLDYAVLDLRLEAESGLSAIELIRQRSPDCRIVILTGYGSIATAVEAVKRGAFQYLTKPVSADLLEATLQGKIKEDIDSASIPPLSKIEREYIDFVLVQNDGNVSKTARVLGMHRQSLQRKLKKHP